MGFNAMMMTCLTLGYLVLGAFFGVSLLIFPITLAVRPFNRHLYFSYVSTVFGVYWYSSLYIIEHFNGTKVKLYGELPLASDSVLVLSNHKCDLDYTYLWSAIARVDPRRIGLFKAVLKEAIKYVPVFSWGLKASGFLFLSRTWETDRIHIKKWAQAMGRDKIPMYLVLYPEGTRYTERRKVKSDEIAKEKGMPLFESELLLPRTKGLVLLVQCISSYVTCILDMTIAYAKKDGTLLKGSEMGTSVLKKVASGQSPMATVHIHFKRHQMKDLPPEEDKLADWCQEAWRQKDTLLTTLARTGSFPSPLTNVSTPSRFSMLLAMAVFTTLVAIGIQLFITSSWFRWYVPSCRSLVCSLQSLPFYLWLKLPLWILQVSTDRECDSNHDCGYRFAPVVRGWE
uniref:1-acylglycerol-3-phosphate O-acyltransferase n=1 Tax=Pyramimonas obovata TaxID=1411642 RepID=A0A7S0MU81_9CHLO|mmetsp:Transcript_13533/g.28828  ORF Transcript_13533/g.28828 Transcript_13533/m.28828 type:complete len:398 (+) Transcript_13533:65-1258(+)